MNAGTPLGFGVAGKGAREMATRRIPEDIFRLKLSYLEFDRYQAFETLVKEQKVDEIFLALDFQPVFFSLRPFIGFINRLLRRGCP